MSMSSQTIVSGEEMALVARKRGEEEETQQPSGETHHLLCPSTVQESVRLWLKEDIPSFDYAGVVVGNRPETAVLLCKSAGVLCGVPFFDAVFHELGCSVEWNYVEGGNVAPICEVARVSGPANRILQGERTALNVLTRASGIATQARRLSGAAKTLGWAGEVAGTRKTTPGFRAVEKYALLVGGASTHRMDLSQMIMLKDNHIWAAGDISQAVKRARRVGGFSINIEVECRSVAEATEAADAGADIVMLDNFEPEALSKASRALRMAYPGLTIEASGGIREETLPLYCLPTVDVVSMGSLTQGYGAVNFSLKVMKEGRDPRNPRVTASSVTV